MSFSLAPLVKGKETKEIKNELTTSQKNPVYQSDLFRSQNSSSINIKQETSQDNQTVQLYIHKINKQKITPMTTADPSKQYLMQIYSQIIETVDPISEKSLFSYMIAQPEALCLKNQNAKFDQLQTWLGILSKRFSVEMTYIDSQEEANAGSFFLGKYVLFHQKNQNYTSPQFDQTKKFKNGVYKLLWIVTGPPISEDGTHRNEGSSVYMLSEDEKHSDEIITSNEYYLFYDYDHAVI
ncbi:hypothetical protein TVAG_166830 [Trichomonas vaginalis G3]|uniref:Uncharacterized protein n=1 Tax=Trichomonas vaginalis (strain ATCC PRA-98 / G3) TaxID=412133 RepID=A2DE90_TRIV3|nr:hypothetical protein TVAGG3_0175900 [Trichomonas vaginalis G3]EAY21308.1 hypothetical protein TVAG_166830 [Trichomonas vaginalis G3]KAI5548954.1 hypothetical protein TVAGG3_0175900 [Trichomonas vaginalis G3]|eukprot:XP_001582294.1 hypothetical protein [Trichomonas vaginalis G3]